MALAACRLSGWLPRSGGLDAGLAPGRRNRPLRHGDTANSDAHGLMTSVGIDENSCGAAPTPLAHLRTGLAVAMLCQGDIV
jgi:hypothetical protein